MEYYDMPVAQRKTSTHDMELYREGADKLTYRETETPRVIGSFYFSAIAAKYLWGKAPQTIRITVEVIEQ